MSSLSDVLDGIENQLTQAAEALAVGTMSEQLYHSALRGVIPAGMRAAPPPQQPQLEFKNAAGQQLKGRRIMYN